MRELADSTSESIRLRSAGRSVLALWLVLAQPVATAVIVVDEDCTLVDAIDAANTNLPVGSCPAGDPGADTIELSADVLLTEVEPFSEDGTPVIVEDLTLDGTGFSVARDPSASEFRLFNVAPGARFHAQDLSVEGGWATYGGGLLNEGETTLLNTTMSGHVANRFGGAIFNRLGFLTLVNSTISDSRAVDAGAAIWNYGDLVIRESTLTGNDLYQIAGTLYVRGDVFPFQVEVRDSSIADNLGIGVLLDIAEGEVSIENTTISGNGRDGIGGRSLLNLENSTVSGNGGYGVVAAGGTLEVRNSSLVGNAQGGVEYQGGQTLLANSIISGPSPNCGGGVIDGGRNFDEDGSCGAGFGLLTGIDPLLTDNGGVTLTHALLPGSSAADAAGDCSPAIDQRGFLRADGSCDSGAFELGAAPAMPQVSVVGSCPGDLTFTLAGGAAGGVAGIVFSSAPGADPLPGGPCAGVTSGLETPRLLGVVTLDVAGGREVSRSAPSSACGLRLQMVDVTSCASSEVVSLP